MFTILSLFKSKGFTREQHTYLHKLLSQYRKTPQGSWLHDIYLTGFTFKWCEDMNTDNGVLGAFSPLFKYSIFLMPQDTQAQQELSNFYIQLMFPTVVHQLKHAWQYFYKEGAILYTLKSLPVVRLFTIQPEADKQTQKAQAWLNEYLITSDASTLSRNT